MREEKPLDGDGASGFNGFSCLLIGTLFVAR
jgi:hypothetical protein